MVTPRSRLPPPKNTPWTTRNHESGLVVGLRFNPTDYELVHHYLQSRIALGPDQFHSDFVHECPHFFGETEPWEIWQMYGGGEPKKVEPEKTLYFFTRRKRLSPKSTRFERTVGSGTWCGKYPRAVVDNEDLVIGEKREFRYEKGGNKNHNKAWLMEEYHVVGDDSDIVLCALRKNKIPKNAPPSVVDQKRKTTVDQSKAAKRHKKEQTCGVDDHSMEPQGPLIVEQINFQLDQHHPMLQLEKPCAHQDCYFPELLVEDTPYILSIDESDFRSIDELLAQCDNNNLNLVSGQFEEESSEFMTQMLNDHPIESDQFLLT